MNPTASPKAIAADAMLGQRRESGAISASALFVKVSLSRKFGGDTSMGYEIFILGIYPITEVELRPKGLEPPPGPKTGALSS